jgi:hypothetical protein
MESPEAPYLALNVPVSFSEVFFPVWSLQPSSPEVLYGVADVEAQVFGYVDALNAARMGRVVLRMVDLVAHTVPMK